MSISNKKKVPSICPYCGVGCGIYLVVSENKIIKIEGDKSHPINGGKLCPKGYYGYEFIYDSARLTYPLIKKGNEFVPVSWTEALTYIAEKLKEIKQKFGP
ncbi:MAG: formate dehydrogenase subunit alpha, partial [Thermodesulfobacteriota bacterium]